MARTKSIIRHFPDFYDAEDSTNIFRQFIDVFGKTLDEVESDLIRVMRTHWVDKADNEGSLGFDTAQKGDLDKIFSLYLESLGGTSQLKQIDRPSGPEGEEDDDIYRERIKGLINVLKSGASSKEGIIAIVAANLGIVEGKEGADEAKSKIRIVEFLPEPFKIGPDKLKLFEEFLVENPNAISTTPEIRILVRSGLPIPMINPRVVNMTTGGFVQYNGVITNEDALSFFPDGTAFLNGVLVPIENETPSLPPGESHWRFEALFGLAEGHFDRTIFDFSIFEKSRLSGVGVFDMKGSNYDEAAFAFPEPAIDLEMTLSKLTPGSIMVLIPWDIAGFTEKFDELPDNPRNQIKYIVDKVKAAGVFAVISYEKQFSEVHELTDLFFGQAQRGAFKENHTAEETNFDISGAYKPYHTTSGIDHEMSDALVTSGMFNYTRFDSLNTFT